MGFRDFLGAMDEYLGDDSEYLGAVRRAPAPRRIAAARPIASAAMRQLSQPMAGVPKPGPRIEPIGFPTISFTAASGVTLSATTRPQKPFKGSRLVVELARSGTTATGLISVATLKVGARDVLVNSNPIGAGTFAPGAFGVELMLDEAVPGIDLAVTLVCSSAPTTTDRIDVAVTIMGMTWS